MRLFRLREHLRGSFWFIPTLCVVSALILAVALRFVDARWSYDPLIFKGGPDSARSLLSTVSASMITFTGLVFSITIVVLQLASQQFSPRVLRTFLRDRHSQVALGVFVATFAYSLTVLREVRSEEASAGEFVPHLSVLVALVFVLLSLAVFVSYIHHISQSIRVGIIARSIGNETRRTLAHIYDHDRVEVEQEVSLGQPSRTIHSDRHGILTALDRDAIVAIAKEDDIIIEVVPEVGDFVPRGYPLFHVHGEYTGRDEDVLKLVDLGTERTMEQDPAFGFRQLVDIAERGLSPAVNDPTTAVQCLDQIHDLLRWLARRAFPVGQRCDSDGRVRLLFPVVTWDDYISLAFDEIRHYGRDSLQVHRRLRSIILDLKQVASEERRPPLDRQLQLLEASVVRDFDDVPDRKVAAQPDDQGIGAA